MSNFWTEIFLWTILQLMIMSEMIAFIKRNVLIESQSKKIDPFEILNSWNTLSHLLYIQLVF